MSQLPFFVHILYKRMSMKKKCTSCAKKMVKKVKKADKIIRAKDKVEKVMHEFKERELHSGSKRGPVVRNPKQAIAIALSEARKVSKKKK